MKKLVALFAVFISVFAVAACGSSDSNPEVTPDTLASAMDEVCTETNGDFEALGTRGLTNPALALEFEGTAEVRQVVVDGFNELNVNEEAQADLDRYIAASEKIIASDKAIAAAAADEDNAALNKAFQEQSKAFAERDAIAKEIGTEVCGQPAEIRIGESGTAPPEDLNYAEPKNTIEEAADAYIKAFRQKECAAVNRNRHTDAGEMEMTQCETAFGTFAGATIEATEAYGPAGQAEIVAKDGTHFPTYFVEDLDGMLRYGGDAIHDGGGMLPAPEGNDAQDVADAVFQSLRDSDVEAFNATLPDESSGFMVKGENLDSFSDGKFNADFIADVKASDADPIQLGLNSAFGFYFLEGSEYDWVMTLIHIPGIGGHYGLSGYYPVPKAE